MEPTFPISEASRLMGIDRPTISNWLATGIISRVPGNGVAKVDRAGLLAIGLIRRLRNAGFNREAIMPVAELMRDLAVEDIESHLVAGRSILSFAVGLPPRLCKPSESIKNATGELQILASIDLQVLWEKLNAGLERFAKSPALLG